MQGMDDQNPTDSLRRAYRAGKDHDTSVTVSSSCTGMDLVMNGVVMFQRKHFKLI